MSLADVGPVLLVGAGRMGGAMLEGWLGRGLDPAVTSIIDPAPSEKVLELVSARGLHLNPEDPDSSPPSVVVIAVKPQVVDEILPTLTAHIPPGALVVSIAAGKAIDSLARHLPERTPIIRAMPNTPAAIARGITVCVANRRANKAQRALATTLLEACGEVAWIDDEALMDAVTAVSGSGPAYVFLLAECLAEAGRAAGLPTDLAARLARVTVSGAGELMHRSTHDPAGLRENVTSPGGTTAAALDVLMADDGFRPLLQNAVAAATRRSRELAG